MDSVEVHPLVLLSVCDHQARVSPARKRRVVGILLGNKTKGKISVTNSYALPFEESYEGSVLFLDNNYHEEMHAMFYKVNSKEKIVGWYHTGGKIMESDMQIHKIVEKYTVNPILCVFDPSTETEETKINSFVVVIGNEGKGLLDNAMFTSLITKVEGEEAEEIGVEHLLHKIRIQKSGGMLENGKRKQDTAIKRIKETFNGIAEYVDGVSKMEKEPDEFLMGDIKKLTGNLVLSDKRELKEIEETEVDVMRKQYLGYLTKVIIGVHDLVSNREEYYDEKSN
eukprot:GHVP01031538.1.p1 GENE.GHVP01031538.1~~GHVP01031538.1.p1  ORF type:complete len:282 (+),score=65.58 GHVP01031538.1:3-848(+)